MKEKCEICGCDLHRGGGVYATDTVEGRSHATRHHYVAERFFGRTGNRRGEQRDKLFKACPWGLERKTALFCYECHELLLHNPVLLPADIERFAEIVRRNELDEIRKTTDKDKIAGRIQLLHDVIEKGLDYFFGAGTAPSLQMKTIQDNIFSVAPKCTEMAILWMKSGFSKLFTDWWSSFSPRLRRKKLFERKDRQWIVASFAEKERIWKTDVARIFRIEPPLGTLSYLYIHPNKNDSWVSSPAEAASLTKVALDAAAGLGIQNISMNGIQGGIVRHDREKDQKNARAMIAAIEQWSSENTHQFRSICLVDKENGFQTAK